MIRIAKIMRQARKGCTQHTEVAFLGGSELDRLHLSHHRLIRTFEAQHDTDFIRCRRIAAHLFDDTSDLGNLIRIAFGKLAS